MNEELIQTVSDLLDLEQHESEMGIRHLFHEGTPARDIVLAARELGRRDSGNGRLAVDAND